MGTSKDVLNDKIYELEVQAKKDKETIDKFREETNKGFKIKCLNCLSRNVNIDFENDVFWCGDCQNTMGCLDYGQEINDKERLEE